MFLNLLDYLPPIRSDLSLILNLMRDLLARAQKYSAIIVFIDDNLIVRLNRCGPSALSLRDRLRYVS